MAYNELVLAVMLTVRFANLNWSELIMARGNTSRTWRALLIALCCTAFTIAGCPSSSSLDSESALVDASGALAGTVGSPDRAVTDPPRPEVPPTPVREPTFAPPDISDIGETSVDPSAPGEPAAPVPGISPIRPGQTQSGTLTAGSFDDNLNFDAFRAFLDDLMQNDTEGRLPAISPGKRFVITVSNESGDPIGDARVVVTDRDNDDAQAQPLLNLTTGSDGRVLLLTGIDGGGEVETFNVTVHPPDGSDAVSVTYGADEPEWNVTLQGVESAPPLQLDLAFVVDATGSMSDELEFLKVEIDAIAAAVSDRFPHVDQRYALIVYRDDGDEYVTRTFDFDPSLEQFQTTLAAQRAAGGGDYPEAMHLALEQTAELSWRETGTARMTFLIADAPPHNEHAQRAFDAIVALRQQGLAIYPVAASGAATETELIMRAAAMLTLSEYLFLTDDSGVGNSHEEPSIPCYHVQRLDRVMIRMIAGELAGQRVQPDPDHIIRTVGNPIDGVCMDEQGDGGG
ncbi:MAG: VWA domain-containing protein [Planctomycetes bacterium]|nr:VWA domain-containing protein [Planctomycetota bacterium]